MFVFLSSFFLFFVIGLLLTSYHFFFWNSGPSAITTLRSWVCSFECGFSPTLVSECFFSYTYFILLVFFVIFDLEVSLLLNIPFGFSYIKNCLFYLFFLLILALGYSGELYGGYVRWSY